MKLNVGISKHYFVSSFQPNVWGQVEEVQTELAVCFPLYTKAQHITNAWLLITTDLGVILTNKNRSGEIAWQVCFNIRSTKVFYKVKAKISVSVFLSFLYNCLPWNETRVIGYAYPRQGNRSIILTIWIPLQKLKAQNYGVKVHVLNMVDYRFMSVFNQ